MPIRVLVLEVRKKITASYFLPQPFSAYLQMVKSDWESSSFKEGHRLFLIFSLVLLKREKNKASLKRSSREGTAKKNHIKKTDIQHLNEIKNSKGPSLLAVSLFTINKVGDLWRLMGLLIGVYISQQDLVSDNLGLLCIDECRLVVSSWSPFQGGRGDWKRFGARLSWKTVYLEFLPGPLGP